MKTRIKKNTTSWLPVVISAATAAVLAAVLLVGMFHKKKQ